MKIPASVVGFNNEAIKGEVLLRGGDGNTLLEKGMRVEGKQVTCYVLTDDDDAITPCMVFTSGTVEFVDLVVDGILRATHTNEKGMRTTRKNFDAVCAHPFIKINNKRSALKSCNMQIQRRNTEDDAPPVPGQPCSSVGTIELQVFRLNPAAGNDGHARRAPTFEDYATWQLQNPRVDTEGASSPFQIGFVNYKAYGGPAKTRVLKAWPGNFKLVVSFKFVLCSAAEFKKFGFTNIPAYRGTPWPIGGSAAAKQRELTNTPAPSSIADGEETDSNDDVDLEESLSVPKAKDVRKKTVESTGPSDDAPIHSALEKLTESRSCEADHEDPSDEVFDSLPSNGKFTGRKMNAGEDNGNQIEIVITAKPKDKAKSISGMPGAPAAAYRKKLQEQSELEEEEPTAGTNTILVDRSNGKVSDDNLSQVIAEDLRSNIRHNGSLLARQASEPLETIETIEKSDDHSVRSHSAGPEVFNNLDPLTPPPSTKKRQYKKFADLEHQHSASASPPHTRIKSPKLDDIFNSQPITFSSVFRKPKGGVKKVAGETGDEKAAEESHGTRAFSPAFNFDGLEDLNDPHVYSKSQGDIAILDFASPKADKTKSFINLDDESDVEMKYIEGKESLETRRKREDSESSQGSTVLADPESIEEAVKNSAIRGGISQYSQNKGTKVRSQNKSQSQNNTQSQKNTQPQNKSQPSKMSQSSEQTASSKTDIDEVKVNSPVMSQSTDNAHSDDAADKIEIVVDTEMKDVENVDKDSLLPIGLGIKDDQTDEDELAITVDTTTPPKKAEMKEEVKPAAAPKTPASKGSKEKKAAPASTTSTQAEAAPASQTPVKKSRKKPEPKATPKIDPETPKSKDKASPKTPYTPTPAPKGTGKATAAKGAAKTTAAQKRKASKITAAAVVDEPRKATESPALRQSALVEKEMTDAAARLEAAEVKKKQLMEQLETAKAIKAQKSKANAVIAKAKEVEDENAALQAEIDALLAGASTDDEL